MTPDYTPLIKEIKRLLTLGEEGYKIYIDKLAEKEQNVANTETGNINCRKR